MKKLALFFIALSCALLLCSGRSLRPANNLDELLFALNARGYGAAVLASAQAFPAPSSGSVYGADSVDFVAAGDERFAVYHYKNADELDRGLWKYGFATMLREAPFDPYAYTVGSLFVLYDGENPLFAAELKRLCATPNPHWRVRS